MQRSDKVSHVNLPFVFIVFSLTMATNQFNISLYQIVGLNGCDPTLTKYTLDEHFFQVQVQLPVNVWKNVNALPFSGPRLTWTSWIGICLKWLVTLKIPITHVHSGI